MKKIAIAMVAALVAASAFAGASWLGNSLVNINGTWYNCSAEYDWADGGAFAGKDLGEISSLQIGGQFEVYAGEIWENSAGKFMGYKLDGVDTLLDTAKTGVIGNNMKFETVNEGETSYAAQVVDLSGLADGKHTIEVFFGGIDEQWDAGNNFSATFTTSTSVPEPATMSLLGLGALAMVIRRKLSK